MIKAVQIWAAFLIAVVEGDQVFETSAPLFL
jgi:hypothetical protein